MRSKIVALPSGEIYPVQDNRNGTYTMYVLIDNNIHRNTLTFDKHVVIREPRGLYERGLVSEMNELYEAATDPTITTRVHCS
jgi:hypothetical protein